MIISEADLPPKYRAITMFWAAEINCQDFLNFALHAAPRRTLYTWSDSIRYPVNREVMYHRTGLQVMAKINLFLWESNPSPTIPNQSLSELPSHTGIRYTGN